MSYVNAIAEIHKVLSLLEIKIEGGVIAFEEGVNLISGEPNQIHTFPFIFTIFDQAIFDFPTPDLTEKIYISLHRVCFQTQDKQLAEKQLGCLVDLIPNCLSSNIQNIVVLEPDSGWATVAGIQCRVLDIPTAFRVEFRS